VPESQRATFAPRLRLQDELHLLRDSLGAVDSHYESLLDALQVELGGRRAKIVASSATLAGHDRQTEVLYRRRGRVFPLQGPTSDLSFWSQRSTSLLRKFVAVAPRGSTLDHVTDRTISILQGSVRTFLDNPASICAAEGIDLTHVDALISLYGTDVIYGSTLYDVEAADRSLASNSSLDLTSVQLTGQTDFDEVRATLDRLETPEKEFEDRVHVVAASSMLSHGVDVERLNIMTMLGLPLSTSEFIQTSARVGRRYPGLVHVLHKVARERDGQVFRHFPSYVLHGDRFVEPIPITRRSRRVLDLTIPGMVEARRLQVWEPRSGRALTVIRWLQEYVRSAGISSTTETIELAGMLGLDDEVDGRLIADIRAWLDTWEANLAAPTPGVRWPNELGPTRPMISLRDVEETAPIRDKGIEVRR
jgi:diadenosine tetraphosphatase ApaH/serine/threonine PP2A family protein phosphatase